MKQYFYSFYDLIPFVNTARKWYDRIFSLPYIDISFSKDYEQISELIKETEDNNYEIKINKKIKCSKSTFNKLKETIKLIPVTNTKRINDSIEMREGEVFCIAIPLMYFFEITIKAICIKFFIDDNNLEISILSYDSEVVTCVTTIKMKHDENAKVLFLNIIRLGYVNPKFYGRGVHWIATPDLFKRLFSEWIYSEIERIKQIIKN